MWRRQKKEKPDTTRIKVTQTWPIRVSRNAVARTEPTETGQNGRQPRRDGDGKGESTAEGEIGWREAKARGGLGGRADGGVLCKPQCRASHVPCEVRRCYPMHTAHPVVVECALELRSHRRRSCCLPRRWWWWWPSNATGRPPVAASDDSRELDFFGRRRGPPATSYRDAKGGPSQGSAKERARRR